ncbi:MAG: MFS transporter, partial [Actinobacteria bacterium]|nr:MFS transporter [Actinomycetota bacterium]
GSGGGQLNPATVRHLPAAVQHDVFYAIAHAVTGVFWWVVPASAVVFVLALLIKEVPLRSSQAPAQEAPAQELAEQH